MTVTNLGVRNEYTASSGQTVFNYTFLIFSINDLNVYITPSGNDANDATDITTAYSVSVVGDPTGGSITLSSGASSGDLVTIVSNITNDRTTDYQSSGDFDEGTVNDDFDRNVSLIKQQRDSSGRTLSFPQSLQNATSLTLPLPTAGQYLLWNPTEDGVINGGAPAVVIPLINVATVAAMIADSSLTIGDYVQTAGYLSSSGGGGNLYEVVAASTGTDDGGRFIDLTTHQARGIFLGGIVTTRHFGAACNGVTDDRAASQAALNSILTAGGDLIIDGHSVITGISTPDGLFNGLVVPFNGFSQEPKVRIVFTGAGKLTAGRNDTILIRASTPGVEIIQANLSGGGFTNVWGIGFIAEDRTQVITQVSQSFCKAVRPHIQQCEEGIVIEPGPTITGSDSGAFYITVIDPDLNLNTRGMWLKVSTNSALNRPTRTTIAYPRIERGNVGIDLEYATETLILGPNIQFMDRLTLPLAIPSGIRFGTLTENTQIVGGTAEACDRSIDNSATNQTNTAYGFPLSGVGNNLGSMPRHNSDRVLISNISSTPAALRMDFVNSSFASLVSDITATLTKDLSVITNGVKRMTWFNGITTHFGSLSNITLDASGRQISCTGNIALCGTGFTDLDVDDVVSLRADNSSTAGDTRMFVYDVDNATLERVTVGAADSGGVGFKVLRIPN